MLHCTHTGLRNKSEEVKLTLTFRRDLPKRKGRRRYRENHGNVSRTAKASRCIGTAASEQAHQADPKTALDGHGRRGSENAGRAGAMQRPAYGQRAGRIARNRLTRFHAAITAFDGPRRAMTNEHASSPALSATFSSAKASPLPMVLIVLIDSCSFYSRPALPVLVWRARAAFTGD
jgi:hypothetical protein